MSSSGKRETPAIVLLLFNRPDATRAVVKEVLSAKPRKLYVIADGPRPDHPADQALCDEVRQIVTGAQWDIPIRSDFSDANLGLKKRVSSGLDWVFQHEEQAVILEDDCLPDPSFFRFAGELLERFAHDERVGIISGNNFFWGSNPSEDSYFFSPDVRIWGWATWGRVWRDFSESGLRRDRGDEDVVGLVQKIPSPLRRSALLNTQKKASASSWAQPFVLHCLERGYLNPTPRVNLVTNIGFGGTATHTGFESFTAQVPRRSIDFPLRHPASVAAPQQLGEMEARAHWRRLVTFPLRHPFDFLGRVARFLRQRRVAHGPHSS
jgi:hypothetical protein